MILHMIGNLSINMMNKPPDIYCKSVTFNRRGKTVLYVKAINAIYDIMKAALLF